MLSIIQKARNGDRQALEQTLLRFSARVHSIAYQMIGNSVEAQDIAQEVFLRIFRSLKKYNPQYRFDTWIFRLTVNMCIDHIRKNRRHKNIPLTEINDEKKLEGYSHDLAQSAENKAIKGIIVRLSEDLTLNQRKVFILRDLQEFSTEEVAQIMKCSQITVRVHLSKARQNIKKRLNDHFPGWRQQ